MLFYTPTDRHIGAIARTKWVQQSVCGSTWTLETVLWSTWKLTFYSQPTIPWGMRLVRIQLKQRTEVD